MPHLFQSALLQSLGFAIAGSLWQTALVWLLYMGITSLAPMSSSAKYRLAVAAQLAGFVWFMVSFRFYYVQYSHAFAGLGNGNRQLEPARAVPSPVIAWMIRGEQLLPYISAAYLLLLAALLVRWISGYRSTHILRGAGMATMSEEWNRFAENVAEQLGITRKIRMYLSEAISSPLTIGFLKPVILVPLASINHLTTEQMEAVLLHELAHIKRHDYFVNLLLSIIEIGLFFNPFTQLLSKTIRKERENCCDDYVLRFRYDASSYAEALLRIAYLQAAPALAMTASSGKKSDLLVRVKRMIGQKESRFSYRQQLLAFVTVTGILCCVGWLNPINHAQAQAAQGTHKPTQTYVVEPMAVRVQNPLFNPVFFLSKPLKAEIDQSIAAASKEIMEAGSGPDAENSPVAALSPLIVDALAKASDAIKVTFDGDKIGRSIDSAFAAKSDKGRFMKDMDFSMKQLRLDMNGANITRTLKAAMPSADQWKEIDKAIALVHGPGLRKIVQDALRSADAEIRKQKGAVLNNDRDDDGTGDDSGMHIDISPLVNFNVGDIAERSIQLALAGFSNTSDSLQALSKKLKAINLAKRPALKEKQPAAKEQSSPSQVIISQ